MFGCLLCLGLGASLQAETVTITFPGRVDLPASASKTITALNPGLTILDHANPGATVAKGAPLIIWDNNILIAEMAADTYSREVTRAKNALESLELAIRLAEAEASASSRQETVDLASAALATRSATDPTAIRLSELELDAARRSLESARTTLEQERSYVASGEKPGQVLEDARKAFAQAETAVALAELELQRQRELPDPLAIILADLEYQRKVIDLDLDPDKNLPKDLLSTREEIERRRAKATSVLEQAKDQVRERERNAWNHTPIRRIVIAPEGSPSATRSYIFSKEPLNHSAHISDDGSAFNAERGFGWDGDYQQSLREKASGKRSRRGPRMAKGMTRGPGKGMGKKPSGSWKGRGPGKGSGKGPGKTPLPGVTFLARGQKTWSTIVDPGTYTVTVTVGDAQDWYGAIVRINGKVVFVRNELDAGANHEASATITTDDGRIDITLGDEYDNAIRAEKTGIAKPQPWLFRGLNVWFTSWPIIYLLDEDALKIKAHVHQELVPFLKIPDDESATPSSTAVQPLSEVAELQVAALQKRLATSQIQVDHPGTATISTTVSFIGTTAVPTEPIAMRLGWDAPNPADCITREVLFTPHPEDIPKLRVGTRVSCTLRIDIPDDITTIPLGNVKRDNDRLLIADGSGGHTTSAGFVLGATAVIVPIELPPRPDHEGLTTRARVLPGNAETLAGVVFGRVKTLIDEGSWVEPEDVVIELHNPDLEKRREKESERTNEARQEFLIAAEERRTEARKAKVQEMLLALDVLEKRTKLQQELAKDSEALTSARYSLDDAENEVTLTEEQVARLLATEASTVQVADAKRAAATAKLNQRKSQLEYARSILDRNPTSIDAARTALATAQTAMGNREASTVLRQTRERIARMRAELRLLQATEGSRRIREFDRFKIMRAGIKGRVFYRTSWDDRTNTNRKPDRDFVVWSGKTLGDIVDMSRLEAEAEVPEPLFTRMHKGDQLTLILDQFPSLPLNATIIELGKTFGASVDDQSKLEGVQRQNRVFTVRVSFEPPAEIQDHLSPGNLGNLLLPSGTQDDRDSSQP